MSSAGTPPGMIDLSTVALGDGALVRRTATGWLLSSIRPQWWYIANWPLDRKLAAGQSVQVEADVRAGEVGFSFLREYESQPWSEHVAGPGNVTALLCVSAGDPVPQRILLRSCALDDRPAVVEVRSIRLSSAG